MSKETQEQPFKVLGTKLRLIRQKLQESVSDVSGAVEINIEDLERIERGQELPNEDILLLLISHFSLQDDDAMTLWELAGYDIADGPLGVPFEPDDMSELVVRQPMMMLALDTRILYSDGVYITAGQSGVVLNFTQQAGPRGQSIAIARVGMSQGQARDVLRIFSQTLDQMDRAIQPRALPASTAKRRKTPKPSDAS